MLTRAPENGAFCTREPNHDLQVPADVDVYPGRWDP